MHQTCEQELLSDAGLDAIVAGGLDVDKSRQ